MQHRFLRFLYAIGLAIVGFGLLLGGGWLFVAGPNLAVRALGVVCFVGSWGVSRIAYPLSVRLFGPPNPPGEEG
jgi:hypothetical protein